MSSIIFARKPDRAESHRSRHPPSARSIVVIACGHSRAALDSKNLQIRQEDTIATYENVRDISKQLAMALEKQGYGAVAIPAFIPIDMSDGKQGMVWAVDLRRAAVEAGDTENRPKSDILGQASVEVRTDHSLYFPA